MDPVFTVECSRLGAETMGERLKDIIEVLKKSVIVQVGAEVNHAEGVVDRERWGLFMDVLLQEGNKDFHVEVEHVVFECGQGHLGVSGHSWCRREGVLSQNWGRRTVDSGYE